MCVFVCVCVCVWVCVCSITGCPIMPGDLMGSGTISGPQDQQNHDQNQDQRQDNNSDVGISPAGCLLEATWRGTKPVRLAGTTAYHYLYAQARTLTMPGMSLCTF